MIDRYSQPHPCPNMFQTETPSPLQWAMAQGACFPGMVAGDSLPQRDLQPKATKNQIYCWLRQPLQKENGTITSTVSSFTFTATKCNIFWNIQNMWESWNQLDSNIHTFGSCHKSPPNLWTTPSECPNAPSNAVTVFQDPRRPVSRAPYWQLPVWMS